ILGQAPRRFDEPALRPEEMRAERHQDAAAGGEGEWRTALGSLDHRADHAERGRPVARELELGDTEAEDGARRVDRLRSIGAIEAGQPEARELAAHPAGDRALDGAHGPTPAGVAQPSGAPAGPPSAAVRRHPASLLD